MQRNFAIWILREFGEVEGGILGAGDFCPSLYHFKICSANINGLILISLRNDAFKASTLGLLTNSPVFLKEKLIPSSLLGRLYWYIVI